MNELIDTQPTPDGFDEFWEIYPKKIKRMFAILAYQRALTKIKDKDIINEGARMYERYNRNTEDKYLASPDDWLSQERRTDVYKIDNKKKEEKKEEFIPPTEEEKQRIRERLNKAKSALMSKMT